MGIGKRWLTRRWISLIKRGTELTEGGMGCHTVSGADTRPCADPSCGLMTRRRPVYGTILVGDIHRLGPETRAESLWNNASSLQNAAMHSGKRAVPEEASSPLTICPNEACHAR